MVGWLDDAIVCALGLRRLHDDQRLVLDDAALALCDVAAHPNAKLDDALRTALQEFVDGLWKSSGGVSATGAA